MGVDGEVGNGPSVGAGGKASGTKASGPRLYMVEPSGLYWVRPPSLRRSKLLTMAIGVLRSCDGEGQTGGEGGIGEIRSHSRHAISRDRS